MFDPGRRHWLQFSSLGIGAIAVGEMLMRDNVARADAVAAEADDPWPHHRAAAK